MKNEVQVVACVIEGEEYGLDIGSVQEIIRLQEITRVPHATPFIFGVINLRGRVIPVLDIRKRFNLPTGDYGETTRIIITDSQGTLVGILVDSVSEVIRLQGDLIEHLPTGSGSINTEFFTGIGKIGQRLIIMLNLEKILGLNTEV